MSRIALFSVLGAGILSMSGCSWVRTTFGDWTSSDAHGVESRSVETWSEPSSRGNLSADQRLDRLERAVQDLRGDFDRTVPVLARIVATESELPGLLAELKGLKTDVPAFSSGSPVALTPPSHAGASVPTSSVMQPIYDGPSEHVASAPSGSGQVLAVRTGVHGEKTRLVLDVSSPLDYSYDLDNSEKILILNLPRTAWRAAKQMRFGQSPLLSSYVVQENGKGDARMILELQQPVKILNSGPLKPTGNSGYRVFLDLGPL